MRSGRAPIASLEHRSYLIEVATVAGKIIRANIRKLGERAGERNRPLMQHIAPRQNLGIRDSTPEQGAG